MLWYVQFADEKTWQVRAARLLDLSLGFLLTFRSVCAQSGEKAIDHIPMGACDAVVLPGTR